MSLNANRDQIARGAINFSEVVHDYTWMRIPFLLLRGCRLLHQVARNGDFAKEAAHYHNTDRAFEPLLSGNFKGMEMKFMRVEFLSPSV